MDKRLPRLILASGSPRRIEMLRGLGLALTTRPADVDETPFENEDPELYVLRLARAKVRAQAEPGELVVGADTIVVIDGELLGKPRNEPEARAMLGRLAGRTHRVVTGLALLEPGREPGRERAVDTIASTDVRLTPMTDEQIAWYVASGEPLDKAGSYGIQGLGALFVDSIDGNYPNVVGLPLPVLDDLFQRLGYDLRSFSRLP